MKSKFRFALLLALTTTLACSTDDVGGPIPPTNSTRVLLTDAPFPFDLVERVDVHIVEVAASETADTSSTSFQWITIVEPNTTFNLLNLQRGVTALVGEGDLPAGQYQAIRVVINTNFSSVTMKDGSQASVRWQVPGEIALHALVEEAMAVGTEGASIVIDFDVGRSFLYEETIVGDTISPAAYDFVFIPWIRAVNEAATGAITGTVLGTDIEGNPGPLADATVSILRGHPASGPLTWYTIATGATDVDGNFKIDFLLAGEYIVRATPPTEVRLAPATTTGVNVVVGEETKINLTLPNAAPTSLGLSGESEVDIGESIILRAIVTDQNGDTLSGQPVSWLVGPQNVATVEDPNGGAPTGEYARIVGVSAGVASVVATTFDLFDSTAIVVRDPNALPVAAVELTPLTQTVSVFDSVTVGVTLKDVMGNPILGRAVTWSVSDSTIMQLVTPNNVVVTGVPTYAEFLTLKAGTVMVSASSEGKAGTATVVVQ